MRCISVLFDDFGFLVGFLTNICDHPRGNQGTEEHDDLCTHCFGNGGVATEVCLVTLDDSLDTRLCSSIFISLYARTILCQMSFTAPKQSLLNVHEDMYLAWMSKRFYLF